MNLQSLANKPGWLSARVGFRVAAALLVMVPMWEGTVHTVYPDMAGMLTYCSGATENAIYGKTYTPQECQAQLEYDLARHADGVMNCVHVPLTDGQKVAFVDAAYNIGIAAFCGSSMAKRANAGDMAGACAALSLWVKVKGVPVTGLIRRRAAERKLCEGETTI